MWRQKAVTFTSSSNLVTEHSILRCFQNSPDRDSCCPGKEEVLQCFLGYNLQPVGIVLIKVQSALGEESGGKIGRAHV